MVNPYDGWTLQQLLAERMRVQKRRSSGAQVEAGAAGVRSVKKFEISVDVIIEDLAYALFLKDPVNHPLVTAITRTKAVVYSP